MKNLPKIEDFEFVEEERLRYGDMDMMGHLNNAVYVTLFEIGRVSLLNRTRQTTEGETLRYVVATLTLDYISEITFGDHVSVGTRIGRVGNSSLRLEQALFQNGHCKATCTSIIVAFDLETRKSRPLNDSARAFFEGNLHEGEDSLSTR